MGLDQRMRSWKLRAERDGSTEADSESSPGAVAQEIGVEEDESCAVQVLEPAALYAVQRRAEPGLEAEWTVGVVGRGTQILEYTSKAKQNGEALDL